MSKKIEFINFVEKILETTNEEMNDEAKAYWEALKITEDKGEKPMFTDNGKLILQFLQNNQDIKSWKAKDIAEGLDISSRTASGAMRKLVTDGFVEKLGDSPSIYSITEKGINIEII